MSDTPQAVTYAPAGRPEAVRAVELGLKAGGGQK
jgi:hypothetical protein